jgi:hypothetical protein
MSQKQTHEIPFRHNGGKKTTLVLFSMLLAFSLLAGGCSGTATPAAAAMPVDASATSGDSVNNETRGRLKPAPLGVLPMPSPQAAFRPHRIERRSITALSAVSSAMKSR